MNIVFLSAVLPVAVLLWFVYRRDRLHPEPLGKLLLTFLAGCFSVVPAAAMEALLSAFGPGLPVLDGLYNGFVVAGLSEELCKLVLLMLVVWRSPHFDEYFDGIVYAVYLSLGFACVENVMYVYSSTDALATALMRGLLAVPAHFLFAVTMGYHLSLAKFDPSDRSRHLFHALFYPLLLHGTYDALLMVGEGLGDTPGGLAVRGVLMVAFIVFDVQMWRWGIRRIKRMQERSQEQDFDPSNPFEGFTWNV
ncbi:MAG: PrsW family intramembrane metalloprotease [Bacteroidales bacterium]|nr:PrsW family intramembrane metalloprotease [Bacteroidales bacterium]